MYRREVEIEYDNEDGYRSSLLKCVGTYEDWDKIISYILDATAECAIMGNLFESAAQKHLLVADRYSGIIVLMSYDYLFLFHKCMQLFLLNGCKALDSDIFQALTDKIQA